MKYEVDNDLQSVFNEFDKGLLRNTVHKFTDEKKPDGSGALESAEIPAFLVKLSDLLKNVKNVDEMLNLPTDEQIAAFTQAVDTNGDGLVTYV